MSTKTSKELDRLIEIISELSELKGKVEMFINQVNGDVSEFKSRCTKCMKELRGLVQKNADINTENEQKCIKLENKITELKHEFRIWKLAFATISLVVSPAITFLLIEFLRSVFGL